MRDPYLELLDRIHANGHEPSTIEGALMLNREPLLREDDPTIKQRRVGLLARLAQEYIIDFDMPRAAARAGIDWEEIRTAGREPTFIVMMRDLIENMRAVDVIKREEVLLALKHEALTAPKSSERTTALLGLAKLLGMELPDPEKKAGGAPVINITLHGGTEGERPVVNVTPAPAALPESPLL